MSWRLLTMMTQLSRRSDTLRSWNKIEKHLYLDQKQADSKNCEGKTRWYIEHCELCELRKVESSISYSSACLRCCSQWSTLTLELTDSTYCAQLVATESSRKKWLTMLRQVATTVAIQMRSLDPTDDRTQLNVVTASTFLMKWCLKNELEF